MAGDKQPLVEYIQENREAIAKKSSDSIKVKSERVILLKAKLLLLRDKLAAEALVSGEDRVMIPDTLGDYLGRLGRPLSKRSRTPVRRCIRQDAIQPNRIPS